MCSRKYHLVECPWGKFWGDTRYYILETGSMPAVSWSYTTIITLFSPNHLSNTLPLNILARWSFSPRNNPQCGFNIVRSLTRHTQPLLTPALGSGKLEVYLVTTQVTLSLTNHQSSKIKVGSRKQTEKRSNKEVLVSSAADFPNIEHTARESGGHSQSVGQQQQQQNLSSKKTLSWKTLSQKTGKIKPLPFLSDQKERREKSSLGSIATRPDLEEIRKEIFQVKDAP